MADQKKEEEWGAIDGFSNYEISNRGKIRSKTRKVWHKGSKTHMKLRGKLMRYEEIDYRKSQGSRLPLRPGACPEESAPCPLRPYRRVSEVLSKSSSNLNKQGR